MRKEYIYFNLICAFVSVCFFICILWLWRGGFVKHDKNNINVKTFHKDEIVLLSDEVYSSEDKEDKDLVVDKKKEINLPKEMNLDVPFTSQAPEKNWDEPWQDACEEAAILMLDAYYNDYDLSPLFSKDEILKMIEWEEKNNFGTSININNISKVIDFYFSSDVSVNIIENPSIDQIKENISKGKPVLVVADGKVLPNPYFSNGGPVYHVLIIRGYTEDSFITNDPGTKRGENFVYKYNDLMNAIHDWNDGDVKKGKSVVLTVE